jgi:hypothetical protein
MNITLDHNLLISLEEHGTTRDELRRLVSLHDGGTVTIRVSAIGASERLPGKTYASSFSEFRKRVWALSKRQFEILKPPGYWNITFWDWCVWAEEGSPERDLEEKIHNVLSAEIKFRWKDHAEACSLDPYEAVERQHKEWQKWRNRKCDTLTMWCHIHYKGDILLTEDKDFHQETKKPALIKLGAQEIMEPAEAVALIKGSSWVRG